MSATNLRIVGSLSRMALSPKTMPSALKLASAVVAGPKRFVLARELHCGVASEAPMVIAVQSPKIMEHRVPATDNIYKLDDLKVFQDEQIIQLSFKTGLSVNYSMAQLRNLCSCAACIGGKAFTGANPQSPAASEGELSVARFQSNETELVIEWLDTEYKTNTSNYNLKYLGMQADSEGI